MPVNPLSLPIHHYQPSGEIAHARDPWFLGDTSHAVPAAPESRFRHVGRAALAIPGYLSFVVASFLSWYHVSEKNRAKLRLLLLGTVFCSRSRYVRRMLIILGGGGRRRCRRQRNVRHGDRADFPVDLSSARNGCCCFKGSALGDPGFRSHRPHWEWWQLCARFASRVILPVGPLCAIGKRWLSEQNDQGSSEQSVRACIADIWPAQSVTRGSILPGTCLRAGARDK